MANTVTLVTGASGFLGHAVMKLLTQNGLRPTSAYGASKAAMDMVLRGLWGKVPIDLCSLRFTVIYGPGRQTVFTVEKIVGAALADKIAQIEPMTDWPYIFIDDAAQAALSACFAEGRKQ